MYPAAADLCFGQAWCVPRSLDCPTAGGSTRRGRRSVVLADREAIRGLRRRPPMIQTASAMMLSARPGHNTASQSQLDRSAHHGDLAQQLLEVHKLFLHTVAQVSNDIRDAAVHGSSRHGGLSDQIVPVSLPPSTTGGNGDSRASSHSGPVGLGRRTDPSASCLQGEPAGQLTALSASAHPVVVDGAGPTSAPLPGQPRLSLPQLRALVGTDQWVSGCRYTAPETDLAPVDAFFFIHRVLKPSRVPPLAFAQEEVGALDDNGNWVLNTPPPHWSHIALWALQQFNPGLSSEFIPVLPPQLVLQAEGPPAGDAVRLPLGELVGHVHACFSDGLIPLVCGDFTVDPVNQHVVLAKTLLEHVRLAHVGKFPDEHQRFDAWLRSLLECEKAEYMQLSCGIGVCGIGVNMTCCSSMQTEQSICASTFGTLMRPSIFCRPKFLLTSGSNFPCCQRPSSGGRRGPRTL